ncbi:MAG: type II toxin-antitoxin system prevent-host-death family antitoxin [Alphaproteobacteria bacterium]|nr:type II toxin-antitoxin system prevent-host-death family antitoxin [Alphaproteobacteria bacterium]
MRTVSSREANQKFSKILADAEGGREIVITKRGKPVAKLVPFRAKKISKERQAAIDDLMDMLREGWDLDYANNKMTRDEMHER